MEPRLQYLKASPGAYRAMMGVEEFVRKSGIEESLLHLVKMRASQINGWNRLAIAFRSVPGEYQPPARRPPEPAES